MRAFTGLALCDLRFPRSDNIIQKHLLKRLIGCRNRDPDSIIISLAMLGVLALWEEVIIP
jgi:hypothetical protein